MKVFRPTVLLTLFLCLFCGVLGLGWLREGPSNQELLANFSKAIDYFRGVLSVGGWPWWTPNFMGGHSLAPTLGTILSYFWLLVGSGMAGPFYGPKIIGLIGMAASGFAMFGFAKKFSGSAWTGLLCALFYVTCPQLSQRLAGSEHIVVALCFPFPPLILWALMAVAETASWRNSVLLAMALGGMCLTFDKHALLFLPAMAVFAGWLAVTRGESRRNLRVGLLRTAPPLTLLGALPLLPSLRESRWMALFVDDPFEGWQRTFSIKTALSWFDRGGALMKGLPGYFTVEEGGFYLGAVAILAFAVFLLWRRDESLQTEAGRQCRFFIGMALLYHWLAFGPCSVIEGHLEFLRYAQYAQNWILPLFWFALIAQIWIVIRLWPRCRWRPFWIGAGLAVYLLVPGFELLEKIPGFNQIRAPWSVWQVGGSFCLAMAAGLAASNFLKHARWISWSRFFDTPVCRAGLALLVLILGLVDLAAYQVDFFQGGLPFGTFADFQNAESFLARAPLPGRVYAFSGRYFYLMTPFLSRRSLAMEAFSSYNMERWSRMVHDIGMSSPDLMKAYMNVSGVSYIFIDTRDKDMPVELQANLRRTFPVAYENQHFAILKNESSLAPAFLAREYIAMPPESAVLAGQMLSFARYNFLSVETPVNGPEGFAGEADEKGEIQISPQFKDKEGTPFRAIAMSPLGLRELRSNFHHIEFHPLDQSGGWLVVGESYHPDWKAYAGNREIPVRRAMGSLLAVQLPENPQPIRLEFEPPLWYSGCIDLSLAGWVLCLGLVATGSVIPGKWRENWLSSPPAPVVAEPAAPTPALPLGKCLVIIPAGNDASNLPLVIARIFESSPATDVLIADDPSSGGSVGYVKKHGEFGQRLFLIEQAAQPGPAASYRQGFDWALDRDYDACVQMAADLSYDPADIPRLIEALNNGAGMAIGSRYLDGIRVMNWPQGRLQVSLFAGTYTRALTGLPLSDPASAFNAIRREVLESFDWQRFISTDYGFNIELHFYAWRNGFPVREVPIVFTGPPQGRSKLSLKLGAQAAWRVLRFLPERLEPFGAARVSKSKRPA